MENFNEEIKRIKHLMNSNNILVNSLFEQETEDKEIDKKKEEDSKKELEIAKKRKEEEGKKREEEIAKKRKEEEGKKREEEIAKKRKEEDKNETPIKSLEEELWDFDCDIETVLEFDDFLNDSFIDDSDINKIKSLVIKLVKSCQ